MAPRFAKTSRIGRPRALGNENEDPLQRKVNSLTRENILKELPNLPPTTELSGFLGNVIMQYETDVNACKLKLAEYMKISEDRDLMENHATVLNGKIKRLQGALKKLQDLVYQERGKYLDLQTKYEEVRRKEDVKSAQIRKLLRQTENTKLYNVFASVFREPVPAELGFNIIGSRPRETTTIEVDQETIPKIGDALRQTPLEEAEFLRRSIEETNARLERETALSSEKYAAMLREAEVSLVEAQAQNVKDREKMQYLTKRLKETEDALASTNEELLDLIQNSKRDKILRYFQSYPLENNLRSVMENITTDDKPVEILNRLSVAYENAAMVRDAIEEVATKEVGGFEQIAKEFLKEAVAPHISRGVQTDEVKSSREQVNADRLVKKSVERLNIPRRHEVACEAMPSTSSKYVEAQPKTTSQFVQALVRPELASRSAQALEVRPHLSSKSVQAQEHRPEFRSRSMQAIEAQRELCSKFVQASEVQRKMSSKFVQASEIEPKLSSKFVQAQTESVSQSMQASELQRKMSSKFVQASETEPKLPVQPKLSSKFVQAQIESVSQSMQASEPQRKVSSKFVQASEVQTKLPEVQRKLSSKFVQASAQPDLTSRSVQALIQPDLTSRSTQAVETQPKLTSRSMETLETQPILTSCSMQTLETQPKLSSKAIEARPVLSTKSMQVLDLSQPVPVKPAMYTKSVQALDQRTTSSKSVQALDQRTMSSKSVQSLDQPAMFSKSAQVLAPHSSKYVQAVRSQHKQSKITAVQTDPYFPKQRVPSGIFATKPQEISPRSSGTFTVPEEDVEVIEEQDSEEEEEQESEEEVQIVDTIPPPHYPTKVVKKPCPVSQPETVPKKAKIVQPKIQKVTRAAQTTKTLTQDRKTQSNLIAEATETVSQAKALRQQSGDGLDVMHIISHKYCNQVIAALEDHIEKLLIELKEVEARFANHREAHKVCYDSYVGVQQQLQREQDNRNDIIDPYIRRNAQLVQEVNSLKRQLKRLETYRRLEIEGFLTEITQLKDKLSRFEIEVTKNILLRDSGDSLENVFLESLRKATIMANAVTTDLLNVKGKLNQVEREIRQM